MQNECKITIKRHYKDIAMGLLSNNNIPFEMFDNGMVTKHLPSKLNGYDARMEFAKSIDCKNIAEAIDKCGGKNEFKKIFEAWQN